MSFRRELGAIPRNGWIIGWTAYAGMAAILWFQVHADPEMSHWPRAGQFAFIFGISLVPLAIVCLWGYIYGDAKRRGMHYVMWMLLAIFVPDGIGVILYFILRDPLPSECSNCHSLVLSKLTFCPRCGNAMHPVCPRCGKPLERTWSNCAHCGAKLPALTNPAQSARD